MNNDRATQGAELAIFITLVPPTKGMKEEAIKSGSYTHPLMGTEYPRVRIVTIEEMIELGHRLELPMSLEVLKAAKALETGDGSAGTLI